MKIEAKNIKIAKFASEETLCFEATIYVDGKKVGTAHNHGQGGNTDVHFDDREFQKKVETYCKSLPPIVSDTMMDPHDESKPFSYPQDLENLIDGLINDFDNQKEIKRIEKKIQKEATKGSFFRLEGENEPLCYRTIAANGEKAKAFLDKKYPNKYRFVTAEELLNEAKKLMSA